MLREFERAELLKYRLFAAFGAHVRRADEGAVQRSEFNGLFRYQPFADFLGI